MKYVSLTDQFAVAPQIAAEDLPALKAAGFTTIICNRPDHEVPPPLQARTLEAAAQAEGIAFVVNPVEGGTLGFEAVAPQRAAAEGSAGPVLAYCRSGTRSSVVWALAMAPTLGVDAVLTATATAGYDLAQLRQVLEEAARSG